jgi:hypothetical protein
MKRKIILLSSIVLLVMLFMAGCGSDTPEWFAKVPQLTVTEIDVKMTDYFPAYYGKIENTGNCTVYNAMIRFKIYDSADKEHVIGTAQDYLLNGADIKKGEAVSFEAVCLDLETVEDLKYYTYEITFLEK